MNTHVLDSEAQAITDATSAPPFLYQLGAPGARKLLDDFQSAPIEKADIDEEWITVPAAVGDVRYASSSPWERPDCSRRSCTSTVAAG